MLTVTEVKKMCKEGNCKNCIFENKYGHYSFCKISNDPEPKDMWDKDLDRWLKNNVENRR